jgi:hypothetical protein
VTIGNIIGGLLIALPHPKVEEKIGRIIFGKGKHTLPPIAYLFVTP